MPPPKKKHFLGRFPSRGHSGGAGSVGPSGGAGTRGHSGRAGTRRGSGGAGTRRGSGGAGTRGSSWSAVTWGCSWSANSRERSGSTKLDGASGDEGELGGASGDEGELGGASGGEGKLDGTNSRGCSGSAKLDGASGDEGELGGASGDEGELGGTSGNEGELGGASGGEGKLDGNNSRGRSESADSRGRSVGSGNAELDGTSGDDGELGLAVNSGWFGRRGLEFSADLTDVKDGSKTFALRSALLEAHFRARGYTDFTAGGRWLVGTSSTVKDEPASMSTRSVYCAREPVVVAGGVRRNRWLLRPLQKTIFKESSFQSTWWVSWRNSSTYLSMERPSWVIVRSFSGCEDMLSISLFGVGPVFCYGRTHRHKGRC